MLSTNSNISIKCFDDIQNIYYINLEKREDRKVFFENQMAQLGLINKVKRFNAIECRNGALGCSLSHLSILMNALKNEMNHVLVLEDDILFLNFDLFKKQINDFFKKNISWDVILISGNIIPPFTYIDDCSSCVKVQRCQTTTGYLVNYNYLPKLIRNIKDGILKLSEYPHLHNLYAIDKYWFKLQQKDNWYLIIPLTIVQKEGYSDIEKKNVNYKNVMQSLKI